MIIYGGREVAHMRNQNSLFPVWKSITLRLFRDAISYKTVKSIERRAENEGEYLFTVTLPSLGRAIYQLLETGTFIVPTGFRSHHGIPTVFRELFEKFIDEDLKLKELTKSRIVLIKNLLQILMMFYKLKRPHTEEQEVAAFTKFKQCQNDIKSIPLYREDPVLKEAKQLISCILQGISPYDIIPGHGPGAVAEGNKFNPFNRKHFGFDWPNTLERIFPFSEYACSSIDMCLDLSLEPSEGSPDARICFVPKDSRGPRMICCEPAAKQFVQQGLASALHRALTRSFTWRGKKYDMKYHIPLHNQNVQRERAVFGSLYPDTYATLDLESASDRLAWRLVSKLFPSDWVRALSVVRSSSAVYNNETVKLNTAFPMGSSVCFPVESIVFWSLAQAACCESRENSDITVYGDDIICLCSDVARITRTLTKYGFIINAQKSYSKGGFRESCGCDAINGIDVTPVRFRNDDIDTVEGRESVVMFINNLIEEYSDDIVMDGFLLRHWSFLKDCPRLVLDEPMCLKLGSTFNAINYVSFKVLGSRDLQYDQIYYRTASRIPINRLDGWYGIFNMLISGIYDPRSCCEYSDRRRYTQKTARIV